MKNGQVTKPRLPKVESLSPLPGLAHGGFLKTPLRSKNAALNEREFLGKETEVESRPRYVFVELSANCNLACPMCRERSVYDRGKDMPMDLFKSVADALFPYAEVVDLRGCGESLLHPQFAEAVEYAASFGCQLKIYTNLTVSRHGVLDCLMDHRVITAVSFDAGMDQTFGRIRRGSSLQGVLKNLKKIVNRRDKLGLHPDSVYFSTTIQDGNLLELEQIAQIAHDYGIQLIKLFPLCAPLTVSTHPFNHRDRVCLALESAQRLAKELSLQIDIGASLHPDLTVPYGLFDCCSHPWTHCYVSHNGGIGFCDHLIGLQEYCLERWGQGDFLARWNSPSFQMLRKEHAHGREGLSERFTDCRWCYLLRYCDVEHWLRPSEQNRLVSTSTGRALFSTQHTRAIYDHELAFP